MGKEKNIVVANTRNTGYLLRHNHFDFAGDGNAISNVHDSVYPAS